MAEGCQNTMAHEEQPGYSSTHAGRGILHELPSVSGVRMSCRQPSSESYHGSETRQQKNGSFFQKHLQFEQSLVRIWESVSVGLHLAEHFTASRNLFEFL